MKKLTAEWCEYLLKDLQQKSVTGCGISVKEERYMQALEIALPILEQQEQDDSWIEWGGGDCPVPENSRVDIKFRDGDIGPEQSTTWDWSHHGYLSDIIAYRIIPVQT